MNHSLNLVKIRIDVLYTVHLHAQITEKITKLRYFNGHWLLLRKFNNISGTVTATRGQLFKTNDVVS